MHNAGDFYQISALAAKRLGRRAILIGGSAGNLSDSPDFLELSYADYSQVFPHAAVNVRQGGAGTTGDSMRSGRPMLIALALSPFPCTCATLPPGK